MFQVLPGLSDVNINEGIFVGPDVGKLLSKPYFTQTMDMQKKAWNSFLLPSFLVTVSMQDVSFLEDGMQCFIPIRGDKLKTQVGAENSVMILFKILNNLHSCSVIIFFITDLKFLESSWVWEIS